MIIKCNCKSEYQDKKYGIGNRIANLMLKNGWFRCTVCNKEQQTTIIEMFRIINSSDERDKFRKEKNWKKADELREKINKLGFDIEDTEESYILKKK